MFKSVKDQIWCFDCEWVPDPMAGRLLYNLPRDRADGEVLKAMWEKGGATEREHRQNVGQFVLIEPERHFSLHNWNDVYILFHNNCVKMSVKKGKNPPGIYWSISVPKRKE